MRALSIPSACVAFNRLDLYPDMVGIPHRTTIVRKRLHSSFDRKEFSEAVNDQRRLPTA
jgi:hypothetical protein